MTSESTNPAAQGRSYWDVVGSQLRGNRPAMLGLWTILTIFLLAVVAPAVALDVPFVLKDESGVSFPFFRALFDARIFEKSVDVLFNILFLALVPLVLLFWAGRRLAGAAWAGGVRRAFCIVVVLALGGLYAYVLETRGSSPFRDYVGEAEAGKVEAVFPLIRHAYHRGFPGLYGKSPTDPALADAPGAFLLGTDNQGRDTFVRMLYGTRISLTVGVFAVMIYVSIGILMGAVAGFFGGWTDILVSRWIEWFICFPSFFLILTIVSIIPDRSIFHIMLIIGLVSWTGVARLIRGEFLKQRTMDYAVAAEALGVGKFRIMFAHILPNAVAPVLVSATFGVASAILVESGLAFLGLGDPSAPSWGMTLTDGRANHNLWMIFSPGVAIFITVSALNLLGEGIRDAIDPKMKI